MIFTLRQIPISAFESAPLRRAAAVRKQANNRSRARVALCRKALALFFVAAVPGLRAQSPSGPIQLPASGRALQSGSVNTTQSTSNAGGQNSVNLIDSSVNIQGPYQGSVPTGTDTKTVIDLSLQEALRRALNFNLGVVNATEGMRQARAQRLTFLSQLLPNVNGGFRETVEQTDLVALGLRPSIFPGIPSVIGPYNYFDFRATLTQTVADLTRLHNLRAAAEDVRAAEFTARDARDLVVLAVTGSYLRVIAAGSRVRAAEAAVRTSEATYRQATDQLRNGLNARIDVTRSQVQLQTDRQRLRGLRADFDTQKLTLARIIGLPSGQAFSLSDAFTFSPLEDLTQEDALARARAARADIMAAQAAVRAGDEALKAARSQYLPSVSVEADYGVIGTNPSQSHGTFGMTGSVAFPIWQGHKIKADIEQAQSVLSQRSAEYADLLGQVDFEVRREFIGLAAAADQVSLAQNNVGLAADTLRQSQDRFRAGVADTVEVVQAQQTVEQADNDLISATYEHNLAKAALARALGRAEQTIPQYLKGK
jgi:outer membrane protein TolC